MSKQTTEHPAQLTWHSHLDPWEFLLFGVGWYGTHGLAVLESQINHTYCNHVLQKHGSVTYTRMLSLLISNRTGPPRHTDPGACPAAF